VHIPLALLHKQRLALPSAELMRVNGVNVPREVTQNTKSFARRVTPPRAQTAMRRQGRANKQEAAGRGRASRRSVPPREGGPPPPPGPRTSKGKGLDEVARRTPLSLVSSSQLYLDRCIVGAGVDKGQARVNRSVVRGNRQPHRQPLVLSRGLSPPPLRAQPWPRTYRRASR
jgi:hypothetical protein